MKNLLTTFSSALLLATAALPAQSHVSLRCELADGQATGCYYCPGYQYVIKFVGTQLLSSSVNLNLFVNSYVEIQGLWNGTSVTVLSAQAATSDFSISGNGSIGNHFRYVTNGAPGEMAANLAALGAGFSTPIPDVALMLQPSTAVVMAIGAINGAGELRTDLDIPNDPTLVGLRLFGQGLVAQANGVLHATNVDAKEVR